MRRSPPTVSSGRRRRPAARTPSARGKSGRGAGIRRRPRAPPRRLDRLCNSGPLAARSSRDQGLLAILPAADVEEIDVGGRRVSEHRSAARRDRSLVGSPGARAPRCSRDRRRYSEGRDRDARRERSCHALPVRPRIARGPRRSAAARASPCMWAGTTSSPPSGVAARPRSSASAELGHELDRVLIEAAVREAQRELRRAPAGRDEAVEAGISGSKSTSQIHDTSRPSAISSLSATTATRGAPAATSVLHDLVGAGRVLDQEQEQRSASADVDAARSGRTPRSKRSRPGGDLVEALPPSARRAPPPQARCRRCRGRAAAARTRPPPSGSVEIERSTLSVPSGPTSRAATSSGGRRVAARAGTGSRRDDRRTRRRTSVRRAAAARSTSNRPRAARPRTAHRGSSMPNVTLRRARRRDRPQRVVCVGDQPRRRCGSPPISVAPALGDDLELAVAIELVAKQVPERRPRAAADASHELRQRSLVDLEQPELARRAATSAEATPDRRFAPAALCASRCRGRRIAAAIAAVVVLPFVADTTRSPAASRAASASIAARSIAARSFPGTSCRRRRADA